jgi:S1-C subfamily serine protease
MATQSCRLSQLHLVMLLALICLSATTGCSLCRIQYTSFGSNKSIKIPPVAKARVIDGYGERAQELASQIRLPHNSEKQGFVLYMKSKHELTRQIGSHDYRIIGEITGGGNAYTSMDKLKEKMAQMAAKEGGDIVLILRQEIAERPFVRSTPGYSTTNVYGNTAYTSYRPGTTYAGIMRFPRAAGIVLKYSPGWDAVCQKMLSLDEGTFSKVNTQIKVIEAKMTDFTQFELQQRELVNSAVPATQPRMLKMEVTTVTSQPVPSDCIGTAQQSVVTIHADRSLGSGSCIDTPRTVLTAAHVIDEADAVFVETADGQRVSAVVIRSDPDADLAVLMLNRSIGLQPLKLRETELAVGEECFALGSPQGLSGTVTKGIVSAVRKAKGRQLVQTDTAINRGNSGGPLIDRSGQIIGVCDFKLVGSSDEGLGFAVGPETIRQILNP